MELPSPPDTGLVRYTARASLGGDVFAEDDVRARWSEVGREQRGITLVSLRPDWEPRTLLPVLEAVTGLEGEGYLQLGDGSFLPLVAGGDESEPVGADVVQEAMERSEILVVHGVGPVAPDWLSTAVAAHPRSLHFPLGLAGDRLGGVPEGFRSAGEWMVVPEPPASPLSTFFSGLGLGGLPPLSELRVGPAPGIVVLEASLARGSDPEPVLVLVETEASRRVVARAQGFWRWGSRGDEARRAYRALWGGVAEWLLAGNVASGNVRPVATRQPRGEPVRWIVPRLAAGAEVSLARLDVGGDGSFDSTDPGAEPELQGTLSPTEDGSAATPSVDPGIYRYSVTLPTAEGDAASGFLEVERWVPALELPPLEPPVERIEGLARDNGLRDRGGRPLRTHPIPYLLLLAFLCAEWLGRRRAGLR